MKPLRIHFRPGAGVAAQRGVALVIVLAFVVLLTGLIVAFFSHAIADRQIANSSANQAAVDIFVQGAVNTIQGDLREEIAAGSTAANAAYLPSAANERRASLPYAFADSPDNSVLVKRSANGKAFFVEPTAQTGSSGSVYPQITNYPPSQRAAPVSTATASLNGRVITAERWNKPLLFNVDPARGATGLPAAMVPDWIQVARDGSNPTAVNRDVIGRFAYTMYDEGALLDANAAGGPVFTKPQIGAKGSLTLADLTQVFFSQQQVDTLSGWRSNASAQATGSVASGYTIGSLDSFYNFITQTGFTTANTTGFLTVGAPPASVTPTRQTDKMFSSRQELIRFIVQGMAANPADTSERLKLQGLLQSLGTFTREKNAPSFMPKLPTGSTVNYPVLAGVDGAVNPNASSVRVQTAFTRADGTQAKSGEPLLKYRFPLRRLGWFDDVANHAADIQKFFCLRQRAADGWWEYVDPDQTGSPVATVGLPTIKSLEQVSAAGREPTFWEVLQAAILAGSLGQTLAGPDYNYDVGGDPDKTRHLLKIGLCLIDQYDKNDDPMVLTLGYATPIDDPSGGFSVSNTVLISGEENLPGIYMMADQAARDNQTDISPDAYIDGLHQFLLWNPHRNPSAANVNAPGNTIKYQIRAYGDVYTVVFVHLTPDPDDGKVSDVVTHAGTPLTFQTTSSRCFDQMDFIRLTDAVQSECGPTALFPPNGTAPAKSVGFLDGQVKYPKTAKPYTIYKQYPRYMTYMLGKIDANNHWLPYLVLPRYHGFHGDNGTGFDQETSTLNSGQFYTVIPVAHSDPRTNRFGMQESGGVEAQQLSMQNPPWNMLKADGSSVLVPGPGGQAQMDHVRLAFNLSTDSTSDGVIRRYADPDGITRRADGVDNDPNGITEGNPYSVTPIQMANARPTILNRPFTSVAEMGAVFRDVAWRSLNFHTADSADGALLDYFTTNAESETRAGVININHATVETLTAVLRGAYQDPLDTSSNSYLDTTASKTVAQAIRSYLGPIGNPAHVISNAADLPTLTEGLTTSLPSPLKARREVLARAFADVTNTRTWNLLIDVVAQTGRYAPNADTLAKFNVEGERRVWVHLAIDRYTGQIVDRQIEPVTE